MNERAIFEAAAEIHDPDRRRAYLDEACGGDAALRARIEALLTSHESPSQFLNVPAAEQIRSAAASGGDPTTMQPIPGDAATARHPDDDSHDELTAEPDLSFLSPSATPGSIGKLGHYEILKVLGQGAFGTVLKAFDEKLHRLVAIKVMNPQLAATSPPRKRFLREARSAAAIKHENIVQVYSVEEQPLPYLVMEYIDGVTLQQKLDQTGPLELPQIVHIARQVAAGLAAAHAKGLVHRDIKPGNILLEQGAEQRVKITDFGLARAADDASLTRSGFISGTPMYMAPEQATGQSLDHRADQFSFGSVLYQMSCGRPPFRAANTVAVLRRVVEDTPRPLQEILPEIPDWLVAIVTKLHAKKPTDRFPSAKEVADLLARCQSELQLTGQVSCVEMPPAVGHVSNVPAPAPVEAEPATSIPVARPTAPAPGSGHVENVPHAGRRRQFLFVAVAIGIAVLGGVLVKLRDNDRTATEPSNLKSQISNSPSSPAPSAGRHGWPADAPKPAIAPFDAAQAKKHQEEWAAYLKVPVEYTNSIGMKFRLIPPGEFTMGMTREEAEAVAAQFPADPSAQGWVRSSTPEHRVRLTQPFYSGTYEVTQEQYEKVMGTNPSSFSASGHNKDKVAGEDTKQHPAEMVSFIDAVEFCIKLSKQEQLKPVYFSANGAITMIPGDGYRLATEAEWEYACRAGTNTAWFHGEQESTLGTVAWFGGGGGNSGDMTHPVGQLKANPFGLYDVHGNVTEWCQDWFDPQAYAQRSAEPTVDPRGPDAGSARVLRGGVAALGCRSALRCAYDFSYHFHDFGFRVSVSVDAVRQALKVTGPAMPQSPTRDLANRKPGPTAKDPDRELAEWLLSLPAEPKRLTIAVDDQQLAIQRVEELPKSSFHIVGLSASELPADRLTDRELTRFVSFEKLRALEFNGGPFTGITDQGVEAFCNSLAARQFEYFAIGDIPSVTDASIPQFNRLSSLRGLNLSGSQITDAGIRQLALPELRGLVLGRGVRVTPKGLAGLSAQCPNLVDVAFSGTRLGDADLSSLQQWRLHTLQLAHTQITSGGLQAVGKITTLQQLFIEHNPSIDDEALRLLLGLDQLITLRATETSITDAGLETLAKLQNLTLLDIRGCRNLTADGVRKLQTALPKCKIESDFKVPDREVAEWVLSLPEPRSVRIRVGDQQLEIKRVEDLPRIPFSIFDFGAGPLPADRFADRDLSRLGSLKHLVGFTIHGGPFTGITDQGVEAFSRSPAAQEIHGFAVSTIPNVTDASIKHFNRLQSLTGLHLSGSRITDAGVKQLALPKLKGLVLGHEARITPKGMEGLAPQCPNLVDVSFHMTRLGDADLTPLQQWQLDTLDLAGTEIAPSSLQVVGQMTSLQRLFIHGNTSVNDESLRHLAGLDQLQTLIANHTSITDAGLETLAKLRNLTTLGLRECNNLTAKGVHKLQAALPKCRIESDFTSPDREVAEWMLSLPGEGHHITLHSEKEGLRSIYRLRELPSEDFRVHAIGIGSGGRITDTELARLGKCQSLESLGFFVTETATVTDAGIDALSNSPAAKSLLDFSFYHELPNVSDRSVASLNRLQNLQRLSINAQFSDQGLQQLNLPKLTALRFVGPKVTINGFTGLAARSPQITEIDMWGRVFERQDLKPLTQWPLTLLHLQGAGISDSEIKPLSDLRTLRSLNLNGNPLHDASVRQLLSLTELEHLSLHQALISDESCSMLTQLPKLKDLALHETKITDVGLESLAKIKTLEHLLIVTCPGITEAGVRKLQAALPKCKIESDFKDPDRTLAEWVLSLPGKNHVGLLSHGDQQHSVITTGEQLPAMPFFVTEVGIPAGLKNEADVLRLGTVEHIGRVDITGLSGSNQGFTDQAIEQLSHSPLAKSLHTFHCEPLPNVTDASIEALNRFQGLGFLALGYSQVTDAGFSRLKLPLLQTLYMPGSKVTTAGMKGLAARSPKLFSLYWDHPGTNENYSAIADLPLTFFQHGHTKIKAADLKDIAQIKTLEDLVIRCDLDDDAARSLRELMNLKLLYIQASTPAESVWEILSDIPKLTQLLLHDTVISDRGVEALARNQRLKGLTIVNADVTDKSLESLAKMTNLEELAIQGNPRITEPAVRKLQAALPKCKILWDGGVIEPRSVEQSK